MPESKFGGTMEANATFMQLCILLSCMCLPISCVTTTILHEITLTCNMSCHGPRKWTSNDELVIECQDHDADHCQVGDRFKKRVRMSNDSLDLTISKVEYNDQGSYVGTCGDQHRYRTLKVLFPQNMTASSEEDVTLHCYAATNITFVLWEKDGQPVLQYKNGQLSFGPMMESRASVSEDHFKNGDFSLHLFKVTQSDQGLYQCHYSERRETDKFKGAPNSFWLKVEVGETLTQPCKDVLFVVLGVILASGVIGIFHTKGKYQSQCPCITGASLPTPGQGGAPVHEVVAAADQDPVEPRHTTITVPEPESDYNQLSVPLMETHGKRSPSMESLEFGTSCCLTRQI